MSARKKSTTSAEANDPAFQLSSVRADFIATAVFEIGRICDVLRSEIDAHDSAGQIQPIARSLLPRMQLLSDVIGECVGLGDDWDDDYMRAIVADGERPAHMPKVREAIRAAEGGAA